MNGMGAIAILMMVHGMTMNVAAAEDSTTMQTNPYLTSHTAEIFCADFSVGSLLRGVAFATWFAVGRWAGTR